MSIELKDFNWDLVPVKTGVTANPAAGAASVATITVPAGKRWKVLRFFFSFVTAADVANRYVYASIKDDGTNVTDECISSIAQTASLTIYYGFGDHAAGGSLAGLVISVPWPEPVLEAGAIISIGYNSGAATDDMSAVRYAYQEVSA